MNDARRLWLSAAYAAIAFVLVGLALFQALRDDMHHNLSWGPTAEIESMSIAISDMVYGLDRGYVMYKAVFDHLDGKIWQDGMSDIEASRARMRDSVLINQAILDATKLDIAPNTAPWGDLESLSNRTWIPVLVEDIGRADYYELAFSLFGFNVEGIHYMYFLLLFCATALFCLGFYNNQAALLILVAYLAGLNVILQSQIFSVSAPSISSYRAISTLAIIPLAHLALATWASARARSASTIALVLQACLFIFVVWTRTSVQWGALAIALVALPAWWLGTHRRWWHALIPVALISVGLLGLAGYTRYAAHPVYFTDELLPGHLVWHSAYIGLSLHPEWPQDGTFGDAIPFNASIAYMKKTEPDFPFTQGKIIHRLQFRIHERIIRKLYLEFATAHPRYMLELFAWYKPGLYVGIYRSFLSGINGIGVIGGLAAILAIALALVTLPLRAREFAPFVLIPAGAIAFASLAPSMWAYPAPYVMYDTIWALTVLLGLVAATAIAFLLRFCVSSVRQVAGRNAG